MPTSGKRGPTATWLWTELKRLGLPVFSKVDPLNYRLHRGSRATPRDAKLDLFWLTVRHHRPQAGDLGSMLLAAITYYPLYSR
jgi:hypothetical protein